MGPGSTLFNHGTITGTVVGAGAAPVGKAAPSRMIGLDADAPSGLSIVNTGTMIGDVLSQGVAKDEVHNAGSIFGDLVLGKGDDRYDGRAYQALLHWKKASAC